MNRELLKNNYMKEKKFDNTNEREDKEQNYDAHHLAILSPDLMDNQENCILLRKCEDKKELLEHPEYVDWLRRQEGFEKLETADLGVAKAILKPIKKAIKNASNEKKLEQILENLK